MTTATQTDKYSSMVLGALTAEHLMVANPVSVHQDLTVQEATAMLIDKGFSAAPVIDDAETPVGIVSRSDIRLSGLIPHSSHAISAHPMIKLSNSARPFPGPDGRLFSLRPREDQGLRFWDGNSDGERFDVFADSNRRAVCYESAAAGTQDRSASCCARILDLH